MVRLLLLLTLGCCLPNLSLSQKAQTDTLALKFDEIPDPVRKVDELNQLAYELFDHDPVTAYRYADQAFMIADQHGYLKGKRLALTLKGFYFFVKGEFKNALAHYRQGANVPALPDGNLGYNFILTGNLYRSIAAYDSAQHFYNQGIPLLQDESEKRRLAYGYRSLGRLYVVQWKNDLAKDAFRMAKELYTRSGSLYGTAETLFALADLTRNLGDYELAQDYINDGCDIAEKIDDQFLKLQCKINRGEILFKLGEFVASLEELLDVLNQLQGREDPQTLVRIYSALGDVYEVLGQNDLSLRYYLEGLKVSERLDLKHEIGKITSHIAWIYKNQKNYSFAFDFLEKSLKVREHIRDSFGIANSYNVKGVIYFQQKNYPEAITWITKALEIRSAIGHTEGTAACYYNLGMIHEEQKNYREALRYQLKAYEYEKATGNKFNMGIAFSSIGSVYTYLNDFDSARYYLEQAEELGRQTGSLELQMETCYYWSEFFEHQGNHQEALLWHKRYTKLNDSMYHEAGANRLAEMQALYQTDQKDKEINLLSQEKKLQANLLELQKAQINLQGYVIIFVVIALLLVSLLAYKTYKYNKEIKRAHSEIVEQKEELQTQSEELQQAYQTIAESHKELEAKVEERTFALREAYRELDTFFYRASHDFRRPLTTFLGLAEVAKITLVDPNARELFDKVRETATNLDKMLLKLQSISDLGSQQLAYGLVDMAELFDRVLIQFKPALEERNIHTSVTCVMQDCFYSYPEMIFIILENLVENSIAFCRYQGAYLRVRAIQQDERVLIEVEDNGDGIDERYHARIFEMYFRGNDRSKGNGLGLYIIKKAVEKLDGVIAFTSQRDKGTLFSLSFPMKIAEAFEADSEVGERLHL